MKNIVLIGFMGSGKTTVGRILADRLERDFVDTDEVVEERTGKSIRRIFDDDGEESFRGIEARVVESIAGRRDQVVSAGGGVVLQPKNVDSLKAGGTLVYLRLSEQELLERTKHLSGRPLLDGPDRAARVRELMVRRTELYESAADLTVDVGESPPPALADTIAEKLGAQ